MSAPLHDLVVIGSGPGGYTGAIRAAQLGFNVACIEKEPMLGGTCLRVGCIPSKAVLESSARYAESRSVFAQHGIRFDNVRFDVGAMQERKTQIVKGLGQGIAGLFKKHKVTRYTGSGRLLGRDASGALRIAIEGGSAAQEILAKKVLIATGSKEARLPGVTLDGEKIGSSTEALAYGQVPGHLVVIGAGAIGLELGSVWSRLGAQVTVLEYLDRILPGMDLELANAAQKVYEKQGLVFALKTRVKSAQVGSDGRCVVERDGGDPITCDRVLVAVGRVPNTDGLGLENVGIATDQRGRIPVVAHFATQAPGIYAIGDVIVGPMLAHKAEEEAVACVEYLATGYGHVNYDAISYVVYTEPEIASVGKTEEQLKEAGIPYRKGSFPFMANARAKALGDTHGFVKVLAHKETDRVLGAHILGPRASDLIAEVAASIAFGASSEDIARVCHPHPTLSEAIKEACLAVDGRQINY